ncbi:MAG: MarR family transcriptional regulator, partial [Chloroflexia bacterium]|nr:MarR family transcriptional regulator [Chloroflexia bacterium]
VAATEKAGFICRIVSPADGRVRSLELTDRGRELERHAAAYQRAVFAAATADWSDAERREFARFFVRFSTAIVAAVNAERAL